MVWGRLGPDPWAELQVDPARGARAADAPPLNPPLETHASAVRPYYRQRSVVRKYLVSDYGKIKHLEHCRGVIESEGDQWAGL